MDMEQRVGRVHRFGSRQTILVDTLVVKDSREADAYRVARRKLEQITHTLVDPEQFEALFSRVMCLIPPDEFAELVIDTTGADLTVDQQRRLAEMVQRGYQSWDEFHRRFSDHQRTIRALNPGLATWQDLRGFLEEHTGAVEVDGFRGLRFTRPDGEGLPVAAEVSGPRPEIRRWRALHRPGARRHARRRTRGGGREAARDERQGRGRVPPSIRPLDVDDRGRPPPMAGGETPITHRDDVGGPGPGAPDAPLRGGTLGRAGTDPARLPRRRVRRLRRVDRGRPSGRASGACSGRSFAASRRRTAPFTKSSLAARPSGCRTSASSLPKSANVVNATRSCHCSRRSS